MKKERKKAVEAAIPLMTSNASSFTRSRRNSASTIERTDRFKNIEDGLVPFKYSPGTQSNSNIDVRDAVVLCQKAYYNFAIFRNVIDLMTEFSVSDLYFKGGTKKSREFFQALFKKVNIWGLQDKFFREYYRSGNVFVYRFDGKLKPEDVNRITQVYAAEKLQSDVFLPVKYVILNPADIQIQGGASFIRGKYYKTLTDYELSRLQNPQTEEDQELYNALEEDVKELLKRKNKSIVLIPLEANKVSAVFYKKQDYEPFAVPMGYPVLEDINWKAEMKKIDMAIARTTQQAILLITMGSKPEEGGINQKNLEAMQKLFENQSVGRVLIADYTTKAEFVIPNIASLLDSSKYDVVERDIQMGLNNILVGDEKFSNQQAKIEVFMARLTQAREAFINDFLMPEIKKISKTLGFKTYPAPLFDKISLSDNVNMFRIYNRLVELGVLTPEEGITAIETGRLPDKESNVTSQKEFLTFKNEGLYDPLIGGKNKTDSGAGRKSGTSNVGPRQTSPIGAATKFSLLKISANMLSAQKIVVLTEAALKKLHKIKNLDETQKKIAEQIAHLVIANEEPENWESKVSNYLLDPVDKNQERIKSVRDIACEHQVDEFLASILYVSKA